MNLVGKTFGEFFVHSKDSPGSDPDDKRYAVYICFCKCGIAMAVRSIDLLSGRATCCHWCMKEKGIPLPKSKEELQKEYDEIDDIYFSIKRKNFGKLKVLQFDHKTETGVTYWKCQCDCGGVTIVALTNLKSGGVRSCGCLRESFIANECKKYFKEFYNAIPEYRIIKNPQTGFYLPYDIYIPKNIFIEVQGLQHYEPVYYNKCAESFEYQQYKDNLKKQYAKENGIFIEVDLRKIKTPEKAIDYIEKILRKKGFI